MAALASKNVTSQTVNTASNNVNTVGANVQATSAGSKLLKQDYGMQNKTSNATKIF
jgi:membrane fusion protein (multidrug efflux system)